MKMTTLFYAKIVACALAATCALGAAADAGAQTLGDLIKKGKLIVRNSTQGSEIRKDGD